jgi:uncharacterized membrane protein
VVKLYNLVQGRNLHRLAGLSDAMFGVVMTLLILDMHMPTPEKIHSEAGLLDALGALGLQWVAYGMSFLTLGILWTMQQTQFNYIERSTRDLTWIHFGFLFTVTFLPLSTLVLDNFITYRVAIGIYWLNLFAAGTMLYWSWSYAERTGLIKADTPQEVRQSICRRIVIAESLYAIGAALSFIHTWVSIVAIMLVQLDYALAPWMWFRKKSLPSIPN